MTTNFRIFSIAGHSFRRTSATILANSGADMETIMRHGGWRNESCAKIYIEDSLHYKAKTGNMITSSVFGQSSSTVNVADLIVDQLPAAEPSSSMVNGADSSTISDEQSWNDMILDLGTEDETTTRSWYGYCHRGW